MKTTFTFFILLLFILCSKAQSYTGTLSDQTPSPGSTITVNFSLVPPNVGIPNLVIYVYNSNTQAYVMLNTTATFNGNACYALYFVPANTPNNTILQFAIGTNSLPVSYYGTVTSATVLPIIFKNFSALLQGTDKAILKWELADNDHPLNKSIVYRSVDGINFNAIDTVKGFTNQFIYTYTDLLNTDKISYFYKIACLGIDGDKTISTTLVVNKSNVGINSAKILNNANVNNQLFLSGIDLNKYKSSDINVIDMLGRKYQTTILNSNTININYLKTGLYYLKIGANQPLNFIAQ